MPGTDTSNPSKESPVGSLDHNKQGEIYEKATLNVSSQEHKYHSLTPQF